MTYSCSNFADDIYQELTRVGAVRPAEANDENRRDDPGLQADHALRGIARLVEARDSLVQLRTAIVDFCHLKGISMQDGVLCEADERTRKALAELGLTHDGTPLKT